MALHQCHWQSLNLTNTLKWFLFEKYFRTLSQNNSENRLFRVFSSQNCKNVFHRFFPWFLSQRLWVFVQDFLLIVWSKETIFDLEKLGEDCKSIFSKLYSLGNKPFIFRKSLLLWRKSWVNLLNFCGWNNRVAQVVSGSFQLTRSTPYGLSFCLRK